MPSFVDAHTHLTWMVAKQASLDLSKIASPDELVAAAGSAALQSSGAIVRGESFDESEWSHRNLPSLVTLDSVTGEVPVFFRRVCGHLAIVNSAMLRLLDWNIPGVNRETGILKEWPVQNFERMFPLPETAVRRSLSSVEAEVFSYGITGLCTFESPHSAEMLANTEHSLDISFGLTLQGADYSLAFGSGADMLKIFLDGSFGAGSAALLHPYADGTTAKPHYTDEELFSLLFQCGEAGITVAAHAIGATALQQLDRVSSRVFKSLGHGFTIRVEHAEDLRDAWPGTWDPEFHVFSMQPNFVSRWQRPGGMYDRILPLEHSRSLNPFKTVINSGFQLGFGSDSMPLNPLYGLDGAINHRNSTESLSVEEALFAYTLGAASISGLNHLAVSLEAGRVADMVFLSGNPFDRMDGVKVERTIKNGITVYEL
jgi:predicted amidohydrolase YtcJ